ncbi:recombination protein RecR [bacterium]|nr:recombination protein RecR [bacterium]
MNFFGINALESLINSLSHLPGIGKKTAQRLAIFILKSDTQFAEELADAIIKLKHETQLCQRCFNISEGPLCHICKDEHRDGSKICLVEDIIDIMAIESSHEFNGRYHVLGGVISPLSGVMPEDLHIKELIERVTNENLREILMAINPSTEGEATMIYISKLLKNNDVLITQLASGVPIGSNLEFIDPATIGRAILTRRKL